MCHLLPSCGHAGHASPHSGCCWCAGIWRLDMFFKADVSEVRPLLHACPLFTVALQALQLLVLLPSRSIDMFPT